MARSPRDLITDAINWSLWRAKGIPVFPRLAEFRERQWDDPAAHRKRRAELLGNLLAHAVTRVPFYRERVSLTLEAIRADPLASLPSFPILERADLTEHLAELRCSMGRGEWIDSTGGASGTPVRFYRDRTTLAVGLATSDLFFEWAGIERGDRRVKLWGARRDFVRRNAVTNRLTQLLHSTVVLDAFDMSEKAMREYVRVLTDRMPVCIEGYAEALYRLAEFVEREGLEVPSPRAVVSRAGTLHPHMREQLERVLGVPIFDNYGTREVGGMAMECDRHNGLHVFGETTFLEIIDRNGREVGVGEQGEILVTNFWNYTMPFIRYRIGDEAVRGRDVCACGRPYPLLERIVGRSGACFVRPDGGTVVPVFFRHVIGVEYGTGEIDKFQVIQEAIDRVRVRIVPRAGGSGPAPEIREKIAARFREVLGEGCKIEFQIEDEIEPTPTGKHIYTISRVAGRASRNGGTS